MRNLPRREFLMLAHKYLPTKSVVGGYYISEKLDGTRVFWDGGLSRGIPTIQVPYANVTDPKTGKVKKKIKPTATGLWSRYGNPIIAPDWFLNTLPCMPLDGEVWAGRGNFQLSRSICAGDTPGEDWDKAEFAVYGCPPLDIIFSNGRVQNAHMTMDIVHVDITKWLKQHRAGVMKDYVCLSAAQGRVPFEYELTCLQDSLDSSSHVYLHRQKKLPADAAKAAKAVEAELDRVLKLGGEGVVLRNPDSPWLPKRVRTLLKYKPFHDDEGTLVGFTSGRRTDKGSKLLGKIGALILDYNGKRLELSGLTHEEREFAPDMWTIYAADHPGEDMPAEAEGEHFRLGQTVTFRYRELSDDNIPKEAHYLRKRPVE
jgi:DNA ligase-1